MPLPVIRGFYFLSIHLLYASCVCLVAWVLTSSRRGSATTKHWIWVATALNLGLPVAGLLDAFCARHLSWARPLEMIGSAAGGVFGNSRTAPIVCAVWSLGTLLMLVRLGIRLRTERRATLSASSDEIFHFRGVPVCVEESPHVPAVRGFLSPRISLPRGLDQLLSPDEMRAVLLHEATHARRRDNLIRLFQELVLCAVWFHPLAWLTSARLALFRELSCDEMVVESSLEGDLVRALGKLARPEHSLVLEATASSFLTDRLALLGKDRPRRAALAVDALLLALFAGVLALGVYETISHTACCFLPAS